MRSDILYEIGRDEQRRDPVLPEHDEAERESEIGDSWRTKKLQDRVGERKLEEFRAVFAACVLKSTRASNLPTGIDAGPSFP